MAVIEIRDNKSGRVLARHISADEWDKGGLQFYSKVDEYLQVGTWVYGAGKQLLAHAHYDVRREITRTHETLYVKRGRIEARVYNEARELVDTREVREGELLTLMWGGHGYTILENGTQVLEVKNGPYVGPERDRVRFES
jgi:hypothetical protein